ncbi:DEAD-box type RNA helicase [Coemansia sp. RSA 1358]|uniref:DEAD-box type RNA helicase n=1 Tax=Coemansia umbellata TaxID=1424467 RepID=A0ABQ8PSH8_9FUNG|nr:DEAD-box type RNA helicase [Coemansia umbellata]KAJ2624602.1 DEAD-box type RNA helicase [Coemansia sp. RSA 1358]
MDKEQIWPQISRDTGCSPTDFVQRIMSHPDICAIFQTEIQDLASVDTLTEKALLAQNRQLKPILEWITPFIESLKLPGDSQAIVTLLTELLFTMRNNPKVPLVRKALAAHTAMAIITHCVKLPFAKRFLDDGKFLLSDFLQSNFHIIADIAQNRNELSSSELLISGAEELIELMLREDLSYTFKAISEISETAQKISDAPEMLADSGAQEKCSVPILIHFPALWDSVLMDPQNTNVVRKAIYGVSYLLLYDHLPSSLIRYLPQAWREAYLQFETKRSGLADLLEQLLQLLAAGLSTVDPVTRSEFEREILPSLLRLLLSPSKYTNSIILQLMNISSFDLSDSELVVSQPNKNSSINSTAKRSNNLSDSERDLVCNELFERHQYSFIQALTEIVNDCRVLVNCSRPAYTCSGNIALYARSSIYAVSNLSGSNVSETVVKLFFAFCSLLGSILKANSNNAMQIGNRSIYMDSVLIVFNTVYDMLNSLEFAGFVRMVKASSSLSEDEAMDALSMCVSQMLNYLEGKDPLGVSGRIIRMFGLIASGLAATPGTSMLYPVETVRALINGSSGRLTPDMRKLLKEITSKSVWEPRSIAINKTKPVQIVIDDEDAFAAMDELDLSDVLEVSFDPQACTDPIVAIDSPKTGYWADIDTHNQKAKDKTGGMARSPGAGSVSLENVKVTQFTSDDASHIKIRKQTSMKDWVSRVASKCDSLTAKLNQEPSSAVNSSSSSSSSVAARTKKQDKSNGLFTQIRSAFVNERKGIALDTRQIVPKIPKQVVKAPRSLATVPVDLWHSDKNHDSRVIEPDGDPMYIRDVSEVALKELEKERGKGSAKQPIYTISDDDGSSSSDESGDEAKPSGLAGLIKIPKSQTGKSQPRRIMRMVSVAGEIVAGGSRFNNTANLAGQFFDPSARDKALAEQRTKMRLAPSMNQLYKKLLGWRYEDVGDCPPDIRASDLRKIPDTFDNCDSYNNVFEPLMLLESWSQFQRSKEESENKDTGEASLESRIGVDDFQEITFRITMADTDMFAECDVLVFAETLAQQKRMAQGLLKDQHNSTIKISKRFAGRHTFLAMVKKKTYGRDGADVIVRAYFQGARLAQSLNKLTLNSCWEFINLYTMTPVQREYSALRSLAYLDEHIVDEILHPRVSSRRPALSHAEVRQLMEIHALNQPQAEAVAAAIKQEHGFTLIQGPPGTGKTKTILGLSGVLVSDSKDRKDPVSSALFNSSENSDGNVARLTRNKLLICAPSNAAVDEIVKRLKNGIRDNTGSTFYPRVVRVGQSESISSTVKDTTLDFLLDKALNSFDSNLRSKNSNFTKDMSDQQSSLLLDIAGQRRREDGKAVAEAASAKENQKEAQESVRSLRTQLDEANQEIRELDAQMQKVDVSDTIAMRNLRDKYYESKQKKQMITQKLTLERERVRNTGKAIDETKAKIRMQILQKTDILCCTLSGSGHEMMASLNCTFETVIIDEAAQSIELSCLIPMKYGCKRCILVGDPNQLPPTVFSQTAMQQLYNQSIFVRIQKNAPNVVNLLSIQYRMHPEISVFPSRLFYESRLKDGPEMAAKQRAPWHNSKNYPPFMFFNISSGKEQMGMSRSVFNMDEVMAAVQLVYSLCTDFPDLPWKQRIGVITPYKQQLRKLVETFKQFFGELAKEAIEFNTVDGFQGQEKDIIIFSCVRAGEGGVGFLSDKRRMNVGLTRARKSLFVLGNAKLLAASPLWKQLIDDSSARGLLLDSPLPLFGRHAQRGTRIDGLLKDISDGAKNSIDGEGDRAEFIMEPINEDSLNSIGEAIAETKIGGGDESNPGLKESSVSVKDGYSSEKRKHQVLSESNRVHDQKPDSRTHIAEPTDRQKKRRLSEEKQLDGLNERRARSISSSSSSAAPHVCVRPPSRPPMDLQAQIAANREKQRSALFIPKKRGGREEYIAYTYK